MLPRVRSAAPAMTLATAVIVIAMVAPATNARFSQTSDGRTSITFSDDPGLYPQPETPAEDQTVQYSMKEGEASESSQ